MLVNGLEEGYFGDKWPCAFVQDMYLHGGRLFVRLISYCILFFVLTSCTSSGDKEGKIGLSGVWKISVDSNKLAASYKVGIREESDYIVFDLCGSIFRNEKFEKSGDGYFKNKSGKAIKIIDRENIELLGSGWGISLRKISDESYFEAGSLHIESADFTEVSASSNVCAASQVVVGEYPTSILIVAPYRNDIATISVNFKGLTGNGDFDNSDIEINPDSLMKNNYFSITSDSLFEQVGSRTLIFLKGHITVETLTQDIVKLQFNLESNDGHFIAGTVNVRV
ncbi:MAG: hypothetical protein OEW58_13005 [Gammaproteobacteria bacterium]|nr:hypothetical protein [Gammaproteobacteria bacterium]